jgi:bifunctional non-homologous end joining protein LigD
MKLEGILSKRADSRYRAGRSQAWLKVKCSQGQEFIIIGWQPSTVKKRPFSSILVATRSEDKLTYRGRVGSGFGERELEMLGKKFAALGTDTPPAGDIPPAVARASRFVRPELVAEVEFAGWTGDGYVRHGAFKGLRSDKEAQDVVREIPRKARAVTKQPGPAAIVTVDTDRDTAKLEIAGVRVTHPEKVLYPAEKITKRQIIDYFLLVKDRILPHVVDRPLSLVRYPDGMAGDGFFQKHASRGFPREFKPIVIREKEGKGEYLYIQDERGLVAAVQMGALELHIWGSRIDKLEQPDRLVFDFDPDEAVDFKVVAESAQEVRDRLKALGLVSFAMVTGGKGVHVVVPLTPSDDWENVRIFAEAVARTIAAESPDRYVAEMSKQRRVGKIFIDYLRNGRGATAIAPYSTRARKGAPVAWPVTWPALARLKSAHETRIDNAAATLKKERKDPWAGYFDVDQVLPLKKLAR